MTKFLVLYRSTMSAKEIMAKVTPAQGKASMDASMAWSKKAGKAIVDMGAPLGDSALIKGKVGQGYVGGYSLVQAASVDAAKKMFDGHPHLAAPRTSIELLEILARPGLYLAPLGSQVQPRATSHHRVRRTIHNVLRPLGT